jgi:hypothetical protein
MKFEPRDYEFNELTNLETFKAFLKRKFRISFKIFKCKTKALNQRINKKNQNRVWKIRNGI